jgi:peptidyl-prolyl cis-trans isomerase A (cyclophilin A)
MSGRGTAAARALRRAALAALVLAAAARGQSEGIFADFSTSMGDFAVRLDYERAPRAVASFVGLATGEKTWADPNLNLRNDPYYDGTIFHRVVKDGQTNGIAIQAGGFPTYSVNTNTGAVATNFTNAGYAFWDDVDNGLAHSNGAISMANSGPNTDGSQFFVTSADVAGWDGSYTVFGHVVSGMPVVASIAAVPVQGSGARPVVDVRLHAVGIRRVGAAAEAFDVGAQELPTYEFAPIRLFRADGVAQLEIELATQTKPLKLGESVDAFEWETQDLPSPTDLSSPTDLVYEGPDDVLTGTMGDVDRYFAYSTRLRYPQPVASPASNRGRTFTFWWEGYDLKYEATFNASNLVAGSAWVTDGTNPPAARVVFVGDAWTRSAYSARLTFMDDLAREYSYSLGFTPGQATNRFTASVFLFPFGPTFPIRGTFTVE